MYFSITWQKWCDVWIHLHILSAQLHVCGSWMWAPGQPAVLPAPGPGKEPETSPWGCAAVQLKTWPCLLCSCWPTTCFADKPAPLPHSAVGLPHWGSLWWVSLEEIDRFNVNYKKKLYYYYFYCSFKWVASPRAAAMLYPLMPTTSCALTSSQ